MKKFLVLLLFASFLCSVEAANPTEVTSTQLLNQLAAINDDICLKLDALIFLSQVLCIACSFQCGISLFQMCIHTKNQKNLV